MGQRVRDAVKRTSIFRRGWGPRIPVRSARSESCAGAVESSTPTPRGDRFFFVPLSSMIDDSCSISRQGHSMPHLGWFQRRHLSFAAPSRHPMHQCISSRVRVHQLNLSFSSSTFPLPAHVASTHQTGMDLLRIATELAYFTTNQIPSLERDAQWTCTLWVLVCVRFT